MGKFKNKYRSETTRLQKWNYGWNAAYFVTICTKNRIHFFGNIINGENNLSEIGEMANKYWLEIPNHFPFVKLGAFVIMPNHVHGIVIIDKKNNDGCGVVV
jgi:REP element-mobilizing transposase RayT